LQSPKNLCRDANNIPKKFRHTKNYWTAMNTLSTVLVPTTEREIIDLSKLFAAWKKHALIRRTCSKSDQKISPKVKRLLITFPCEKSIPLEKSVEELFRERNLHSVFEELKVVFLALDPIDDIYHGRFRDFALSQAASALDAIRKSLFGKPSHKRRTAYRITLPQTIISIRERYPIVPKCLRKSITTLKIFIRHYAIRLYYVLLTQKRRPDLGHKSGPNLQFFKSLEYSHRGGWTLLNEVDMIPISPYWLEDCHTAINQSPSSYIIGSRYLGSNDLGADIAEHLNGNAIYATHDNRFRDHVIPKIRADLSRYSTHDPLIAYDTFIATMARKPTWRAKSTLIDKLWYENLLQQLTTTNIIANYGYRKDELTLEDLQRLRFDKGVALVHSRASLETLHLFVSKLIY